MHKKLFQKLQTLGIYFALIILIILFTLMNSSFFSASNFINILRQVSTMGIMAVGAMFVMLTGGVDLSVGTQISIVGISTAYFMVNYGMNPVPAVLLGFAIGIVIGIANGIIVTKTKIPPMIATLGMMQIVKGLSYTICQGLPIFGFPEKFAFIGQGSIGIIPFPIILFILCVLVGSFVLNKTVFGRSLYAIGSNEEASRLSGIQVKRQKLIAYIVCSAFTGIAALITLSRINAGQPISGIGSEMDVLTAIILGGVSFTGGEGKVSGAVAGVLILGVLSNGMVMAGLGEYMQVILKGAVLLFALSLDGLKQRHA
ncbi:ribose transport system permease protein/inositol transport system permease protein [Ruminiclostridium sufflavum DSM 19573]|uniref:Ribose transport system permease protein/inositol transport system permease protein n=1 Tax=Ruminiclostridium sufflavum DSM 19573 TaxID=1121337 RepID=A0A318YCD8_9FIRM|nr:ABC transporter permease [Ruminiclostridium sufflavum]PYG90272.1 ribose transport system permease protein/inositol transport system permease protein [Ruminiclostridium sufflavum DSM 19573]